MATSQELIEIWHFLEQQEIRLIELDHRFRALLETLKTQPLQAPMPRPGRGTAKKGVSTAKVVRSCLTRE